MGAARPQQIKQDKHKFGHLPENRIIGTKEDTVGVTEIETHVQPRLFDEWLKMEDVNPPEWRYKHTKRCFDNKDDKKKSDISFEAGTPWPFRDYTNAQDNVSIAWKTNYFIFNNSFERVWEWFDTVNTFWRTVYFSELDKSDLKKVAKFMQENGRGKLKAVLGIETSTPPA